MSKYEQLIEFIINEQEDKARELFHQIVVEKSREIYESLIDEQDLDEVGGNEVDSMVDEITADEEGMDEGEELDAEFDSEEGEGGEEDEGGLDIGMDHHDDVGGDEELEDRVMDLEDALDQLKSEFDALMGQEGGEEEHGDLGGDELGADDDIGGEEEPIPEMMEGEDDEEDDEEEDVEESIQESKKDKKEDLLKGKKDKKKMTEAEWIREYVEKIGDAYPGNQGNPSGQMVGTGAKSEKQGEKNTKSVVAGKNDMGGTTANIAKGGANADPSGTPSKNPSGLLKQGGEIDVAKRNVNKPGGNKGAQKFYDKQETSYEKAKGAEGQTTDGKVSVDKKSLLKRIGK